LLHSVNHDHAQWMSTGVAECIKGELEGGIPLPSRLEFVQHHSWGSTLAERDFLILVHFVSPKTAFGE